MAGDASHRLVLDGKGDVQVVNFEDDLAVDKVDPVDGET